MLFVVSFPACQVGGDTLAHDEEGERQGYAWGYVETVFHDGSVAPTRPYAADYNYRLAEGAGYGRDVGAYTVEREIAHTFVATRMGLSYSVIKWADAHDTQLPVAAIVYEENIVKAFLRAANLGYGVLTEDEESNIATLLTMSGVVQKYVGEAADPLSLPGRMLGYWIAEWHHLITVTFGRRDWYKHEERGERNSSVAIEQESGLVNKTE